MPHFFYLARCSDDSLYAGTCINLEARQRKHNDGTGAKYTRSRRPVRIVYHEDFETVGDARRREAEVKQWPKEKKERLVAATSRLSDVLRTRWYEVQRRKQNRKYLKRAVATMAVMLAFGSLLFYRMATTPLPPRTPIPPPTVDELLEALKQQAVNP